MQGQRSKVSGRASLVDGEGLHGAGAQGLNVLQEAAGGQNVSRPYDDLTGLHGLGHLVGAAHLGVARPSQNEDDEA